MATLHDVGQFVSVPEGRIHFVKKGSGPPIVFLHSNGQSIWGFESVMEPLSREFTCYALDMLGHGESGKPSVGFTWLDLVGSVAHFMESMTIKRAHLVGVSIGAAISVELAATYPERVDRLVLVGCPVWDAHTAALRIHTMRAELDDNLTRKPFTADQLKARTSFANPRPEWVKKLNELYATAGPSMFHTGSVLAWYDIASRLHHVQASSTLILYGELDSLRDGEDLLLNNIRNAIKVVMPGLAHHPPTENPEAFLKEALPFLRGDRR